MGETYECAAPECDRDFGSEMGAKVHYGRQHASFEEVCSYCGKEFRRNGGEKREYCSHSCAGKGTAERKRYANFVLEDGCGYPRWHGDKSVAVHQLVAVSNGEDPYKVFGRNKYNVDHVNGHKLDNRHENIQLMHISEHGKKDGGREARFTTKDILKVVEKIERESQLSTDKLLEVADIA